VAVLSVELAIRVQTLQLAGQKEQALPLRKNPYSQERQAVDVH
jgi:hypothetical protein